MITFSVIFLVLLEALAIILAFRAVAWSRTPQGAVAWVVFLIAAPYLAILFYLFLGHSKVSGYVLARRDIKEVLSGSKAARVAHPPKPDIHDVGFSAFETIASSPILSGNSLTLLVNGEETFDAIFEAIDAAETYVLIQFYIVRDDQLGNALRNKLIAATSRGVSVRFLYDSVGCSRLPESYVKGLREAGVAIYDTNALRGPTKRFQLNFRNHRKTLVVDGKVGFTGGLNVGDEYMGRDPEFGNWRDTHCALRGPIVKQLQLIFTEDWHWATQESLLTELDWSMSYAEENQDGLLLAAGPADVMDTGNLYFQACIAAAKERIWITSPYLVPDPDIMSALKVAALRGLEVRLLVPAHKDHWITWLAAFAYFDELREAGVQIHMYEDGFMHQKVVLIDHSIASVGTLNLDSRSCRLNFEATAIMFDEKVATDVEIMLSEDLARSVVLDKTITHQPMWIRLSAPIARLFSPIL